MPVDQYGYDRIYRNILQEEGTGFNVHLGKTGKGILAYGAAGAIGGTIGSTVGGYAGAALSAQTGGDPYSGMAAGGMIGGIAGAGVGLAGTAIARNAGSIIGTAGSKLEDIGFGVANAIYDGTALNIAKGVGKAALGGAKAVGGLGFNTAAVGVGVASRAVNTAGFVGSLLTTDYKDSFIRRKLSGASSPEKVNNILGKRFNFAGKVAVGAFAVGSGMVEGFKAHEKYRMGSNDGQVRKATPVYGSSSMDNAGATGDLVFALNANKKSY